MLRSMTTWADGSANAFKDLDAAQTGTGAKLPGQHDLTDDERRTYRKDQDDYSFKTATDLMKATGGRMNQTPAEANSAHRIGQAYDDNLWGGKQEYLKAAQNTPLGDLNDPAARLRAMSFITQDKPLLDGESATDNTQDKHNCSGASIVGAAFLAEGPDGLKKVMAAIEKQDPTGKMTKNDEEYKLLKAKLAKDPSSLSVYDIQTLQQRTTDVLGSTQKTDKELKEAAKDADGIHSKTMDKFMDKSPELAKMFKENGMEIQGIDNDGALDKNGQTGMDHWVVKMKGKDGKEAIYDPLARRGGQIIDFDEGVKHYDKARFDTVGKPD